MLVFSGCSLKSSEMTRYPCFFPELGAINFSILSVYAQNPMCPASWRAEKASTPVTSLRMLNFEFDSRPTRSEALTSSRKKTVCSFSSLKSLTKVPWPLAVVFQSMCRTSSPYWY